MRRAGRWAAALVCLSCLLPACEEAVPVLPTPGAPPAAPDRLPQLEALWRESVQYRSAHRAMAENAASLAHDVERSARMLDTVEAFRRVPVVAAGDAEADAAAVQAAVQVYAKRLGLKVEVEVRVAPAGSTPPPPAAEIDAAEGLRYENSQVLGTHGVEVRFAQGLTVGPKFVGDLNALGRLFEPTGARIGPDGEGVLRGQVYFFRDLKPVKFVRKPPGFAAKLSEFTAPTPAEQARISQIQDNLTQVEAVSPQIEQAFAHQAVMKISTARFRAYGEAIERYNKASWSNALARGL
jgi:predicted amino acid-binding ACT domain protein